MWKIYLHVFSGVDLFSGLEGGNQDWGQQKETTGRKLCIFIHYHLASYKKIRLTLGGGGANDIFGRIIFIGLAIAHCPPPQDRRHCMHYKQIMNNYALKQISGRAFMHFSVSYITHQVVGDHVVGDSPANDCLTSHGTGLPLPCCHWLLFECNYSDRYQATLKREHNVC